MVSVGLLGPLALRVTGSLVTISACKQRQVLALLALRIGQAVTVSAIVDELWGDRPPRSYATTLQTYILQIRNTLSAANPGNPDAARRVLRTHHSGYLFEAELCCVDLHEFDDGVRAGRAAADAGDHRLASDLFGRALQVWRGPALVDVRTGRQLEVEAASLEEQRLGVLQRRVEADLALGRHADLLGELMREVARNPMNENLCAFLMTALYRAGHVGRSLQAFHRLRSVLKEELGVEPCARLCNLQAAILAGDASI